jgi:probable rRNA maturation factor
VIPSDSESPPPVRRRGRRPRNEIQPPQDAASPGVVESPESPPGAIPHELTAAPMDETSATPDAAMDREGETAADSSAPARRRSRGRGRGRGRADASATEAASTEVTSTEVTSTEAASIDAPNAAALNGVDLSTTEVAAEAAPGDAAPLEAPHAERSVSETRNSETRISEAPDAGAVPLEAPHAEPVSPDEEESGFVPLAGFDVPSLPPRTILDVTDDEGDEEDDEVAPPPSPPSFPAGRFQPRAPRPRTFQPIAPPPPLFPAAEDLPDLDGSTDQTATETDEEQDEEQREAFAEPEVSPNQRGRRAAVTSVVTVDVTIPRGFGRRISAKLVRQVIEKAIEKEGLQQPVTVDVVMVTEEEMREINATRRGIDEATDVLSFPLMDVKPGQGVTQDFFQLPPDVQQHLGDVVISVPRVEAQAEEAGHSRERELAFLTVHGILHILGYDHDTDDHRRQMRRREEEILGELGLRRNGNP